jgi:ribosomal protein S1
MTMQNVLETLGISIGNDIQATPDPVVVTGTITSASSDVALVSLPDGREAIMPVSEFFPNRRWVNGETLQMLLMESPGRPVWPAPLECALKWRLQPPVTLPPIQLQL